jgi:glycosyltransferase involved in cell wall biosynthesis
MEKRDKLCAIFNYAPHYRMPIYLEMEKEFNCDFYFGDQLLTPIKKIEYSKLSGFKKELKNYYGKFFLKREGLISLAFKRKYKNYVISWEPLNLSLWVLLVLCKLQGKKVYSWQHGITRKNVSKKYILLEKFSFLFKKGTFLYSHHAKNNMINLGFNPEKIHVIYNSLDYLKNLEYRNINENSKLYSDYYGNFDPVLIFIGRLTPVKKLHMILNVLEELLKKGIKCNVSIIGDGEMRAELEKLVKDKNIERRCWFVGALYSEKEISSYIHNASICVSPGNVGLTAIHSLSYGVPVITNNNFESQMPEFEAIEEGLTGGFFEEDNEKDLLRKIEYWLMNTSKDREGIRNNCYKIIDEKYNPLVQVGILKNIIWAGNPARFIKKII